MIYSLICILRFNSNFMPCGRNRWNRCHTWSKIYGRSAQDERACTSGASLPRASDRSLVCLFFHQFHEYLKVGSAAPVSSIEYPGIGLHQAEYFERREKDKQLRADKTQYLLPRWNIRESVVFVLLSFSSSEVTNRFSVDSQQKWSNKNAKNAVKSKGEMKYIFGLKNIP